MGMEDTWKGLYGEAAPAPTPARTYEDIWKGMYGETPRPIATPKPVPKPPAISTPLEQRALEAEAKGKKLWNVSEAYSGNMDRARQQYNDLISQGANPKEALFLTSAAASESGFNPAAVHDQGTGYGLYGHRLDRLDAMRKFAGVQFPSASQQNAFALQELRSRPEYKMIEGAQNARDLAIAQMHFERPKGYTPSDPTAGLNFAGRLGTLNKFTSLMGEKPEISRGELAPEWGALQSAASGMALGFGPQIRAGYKALRYGVPYGEALADLRRQQEYYKQQNPLMGYGAEALGSMAPIGAGMRLAKPFVEAGVSAAMPYVSTYAPDVARALPAVGRFLGGEAGHAVPLGAEAMPGVGGAALRVGSAAAEGATQAAGQTAVEQASQVLGGSLGDTETPLAQQFGQNVLAGGVLGAGLSRLMRPPKAFTPEWEPGARDIGRQAFDRFGLPVYPGQFAKGEAKQFFEETVPQSVLNEQVKGLSEKAASLVGAKNLSAAELKKAENALKPGYNNFAAGVGPMRLTGGVANKLVDVYNKSFMLRDPTMRKTVQDLVVNVMDDIRLGKMNGQVYRNYTQMGGPIDTKLLGLDNALKKTFGGELKSALDMLVEHNDPAAYRTLQALNRQYRDVQTLKKVAQDSGVANPQALAKAVAKKGSTSALKDLAEVGQFMPKVNAQGEAVVSQSAHHPESLRQKLSKIGMYGAGGYLATEIPFISALLETGGPLTKYAVPFGAAALAGATGSAVRRAAQAKSMSKAPVRKQVFEETYAPSRRALARKAVRPLMHGAVEYNPLNGE